MNWHIYFLNAELIAHFERCDFYSGAEISYNLTRVLFEFFDGHDLVPYMYAVLLPMAIMLSFPRSLIQIRLGYGICSNSIGVGILILVFYVVEIDPHITRTWLVNFIWWCIAHYKKLVMYPSLANGTPPSGFAFATLVPSFKTILGFFCISIWCKICLVQACISSPSLEVCAGLTDIYLPSLCSNRHTFRF